MQQLVRNASRILAVRSSPASQRGLDSCISSRAFFASQSSAAAIAVGLEKTEVTKRVVDLLKSLSFVDPAKVSPTASLKDDLQLDTLENVQVTMAVEQEFAVDIPASEANKFSTTAHLVDYISNHPHAK